MKQYTDAADLISLLILLFLLLLGRPLQKAKGFVVSNPIGMKFGTIVLQVNTDGWSRTFFLTSRCQDGGNGVISRRKVLPPDELTRSVCRMPMQQRTPLPDL